MRSLLRRLALALVSLGVAAVAIICGLALTRWDRTFDAPTPAIFASTDPALLARGDYLVHGPAHCVDCHGATLGGGRTLTLPGGVAHVPNITNDSLTGIGALSDAHLARALRNGVRHDGRAVLPFMAFQQLADRDLQAVLSYLRHAPAVRHVVPPHEYGLVSKAIMALLITPQSASEPLLAAAPDAIGVERGAYLVNAVAQCAGCHTARDGVGRFTGARLAGGLAMESETDPTVLLVTPNLTPDSATGRITRWTTDQFIARMRTGRLIDGSPMPWDAFARMTDDDLRSIHAYLHSLPAVRNDAAVSTTDSRSTTRSSSSEN